MKNKSVTAPATNNLVAKHMNTFNKAHTFVDRKKNAKKGYIKHKSGLSHDH